MRSVRVLQATAASITSPGAAATGARPGLTAGSARRRRQSPPASVAHSRAGCGDRRALASSTYRHSLLAPAVSAGAAARPAMAVRDAHRLRTDQRSRTKRCGQAPTLLTAPPRSAFAYPVLRTRGSDLCHHETVRLHVSSPPSRNAASSMTAPTPGARETSCRGLGYANWRELPRGNPTCVAVVRVGRHRPRRQLPDRRRL